MTRRSEGCGGAKGQCSVGVEVLVMMALWMLSVLAQDTTKPGEKPTPICPSGEHFVEEKGCTPTLLDAQPAATSELLGSVWPLPLQDIPPDVAALLKGVNTNGIQVIIFGSLDKTLVSQVMHAAVEEFRPCYEQRLAERPTLEGRVVIKFVIATDGTVPSAMIKSIDDPLHDEAFEACVVKTTLGLEFPKPNGGIVIISYPFIFKTSETTAPEAPKAPTP